ncbi:hypothetical protein LINPERPRIM_LOCUS32369 [Linum perenne]
MRLIITSNRVSSVAYSITLLVIVFMLILSIWESAPSQEQRSVELLKVFGEPGKLGTERLKSKWTLKRL